MSQVSEAENDIRRLLAMTWRTWGNEPLDASSITRTWSLDLGWLAPTDAEILLTKLLAKGWLISKDDMLSTNAELDDVSVPLGWFPRTTVLEEPPTCPQSNGESQKKSKADTSLSIETNSSPTLVVEQESVGDETTDTRQITSIKKSIVINTGQQSFNVPALLQLISKESNIARQEVMRRAQRK
ncbi:MAG: DUF2240 family protein, partial [Candidatus Poseidoniales archaeon]|nr:DUF2240 family protein [Candidatus Poseidoniales archaeon]